MRLKYLISPENLLENGYDDEIGIDRNYLKLFLHEPNKNCDQSLIIESSDTQSQLCSLWWRVSEYIPKIKSALITPRTVYEWCLNKH